MLDAEEPVEECPADMSNPVTSLPTTPEPTMTVNLNAQGLDEIGELMKLIAKVNPDMPEPAATSMPALPTATPTLPTLPSIDTDDNKDMPTLKIDGDDNEEPEKKDEWANEPDEDIKDVDYMVNKLAGGMNRPKGTHPKVAGGDNPMQRVKEGDDLRAAIRAELAQRLAEIKGAE